MDRLPTWGATKTLADYVKESAWQTNSVVTPSNNPTGGVSTSATSMPWAAAVKSPPDLHHHHHVHHHQQQQHQNHNHQQQQPLGANNHTNSGGSFDYNGAIGSWTSPETGSSSRGGWNADGSSKSDGIFDDGTAIWGNPTTKKTGIDWTEKESLISPPQAQANNNSEKRAQKPETTVSSIDGTEVWGAPVRSQPQQQAAAAVEATTITKNDYSGNIYGTKSSASNHEASLGSSSSLGWGESFSRHQQATANENSSPPNSSASIWNNLGVSKQKSSDWLSSSSGISVGGGPSPTNTLTNTSSRMDELNKQLEMTSLFDTAISPSVKSSSSPSTSNNGSGSLEHHPIGVGLGGYISNNGVCNIGGGNNMNDLNKMSANYSTDLLASPNRQPCGLSTRNNQQSQQLDSATAYSSSANPSKDLLKQMVHQIQLAVQAGHLNAHILNQPMSTPTLQLVYQLLQQIKTLHQLQEIQQRAGIKSDLNSPSNMDLQINRIRQNISLLQKAITQQQATLTKNETHGDPSPSPSASSSSSLSSNINKQPQPIQHQQQQAAVAAAAAAAAVAAANNYSYATISKQSTNNLKVFSNNMSNIINSGNIDSFKRSSLIDTLISSNSDQLRSSQSPFDGGNANLDKTLSSLIQSSSANNILGSNKTITTSNDYPKAQSFTCGTSSSSSNNNGNSSNNVGLGSQQQTANKGLLPAQSSASSSSTSSSAWSSAFSSGDFLSQQQQQGWPVFLKTNNGAGCSIGAQRTPTGLYDWSDLVSSSTLQFSNDNNHLSKQQSASVAAVGGPSSAIGGGRPAPPPGLAAAATSNFGPIIGSSSAASNGIWSNLNEYTD